MDLKESELLGDTAERHWYYRAKVAAMCRYFGTMKPKQVLDVGAGSGFFTKCLLERTSVAAGTCVDTGYPRDWDEQWFGKPLHFRGSCAEVDADLVLLMDVLEHVDDDAALLAEYAAKTPGGARFLITVPAFQWLWSAHDEFLEHRRRYDIAQLEDTVTRAGLAVLRSSYYFGFVLPIAAALRCGEKLRPTANKSPKSQLRQHNWLTNTILMSLCRAELPILSVNRLGGLSVFCLASKP